MSTISASTTSTTAYKVTADTTGTLVLQTGSTPTTAMTIDGSQNVGIGQAPIAGVSLNVYGHANLRDGYNLTWGGTYGAGIPTIFGVAGSSGYLDFRPTGSTLGSAMRIASDGSVGIGTISPIVRLHTAGANVTNPSGGTGAYLTSLLYDTSAGTTGVGGGLGFQGNDGTNSGVVFAAINGSKENSTSGNYASYLSFSTRANGGNITERARIDSSGNLLVGTTSVISGATFYSGSTNGTCSSRNTATTAGHYYTFGHDGNDNFRVLNAANTGVYLTYGGTSWSALSDETTKDIIEPISDAANKVSTLRTVIGKYKTDEEGTRRSFLIAQDVQAVLPEAVNTQPDGKLGLQYADLIPLLTAAIQEQQAIIETLTNRIQALENK